MTRKTQNTYISGVGYEALKPKVLFSDKKHFNATVNTLLPNRGLMSNMLIKDFVFDLFLVKSKLDIRNLNKIHIRIAQYIKPTKKGKLPFLYFATIIKFSSFVYIIYKRPFCLDRPQGFKG